MEIEPDILNSVADLVQIAGKLPPSNVVVPGGHRLEDLKLVEAARDHGIVDRIILVGDRRAIERSIAELGIRIRPDHIVPAEDGPAAAAATAELVTAGRADIVLKGDISTPVINRALQPLAVRPTVSLATVFDAPPISAGRPMVLTDAGFTTVCNFGRMVDLVYNACDVARLVLGIPRPRVAILSANEKPIPSLPSTWLGEKLSGRSWANAVVYGPLSFDLATDPESVALKGLSGPPAAREVAGRADVLVCPGIDTANALYKTLTALNKFGLASLAGITVGFPFPYVILSRADTLETRLESIALCSVFVQRQRSSRRRRPRPAKRSVPSAPRILAFQPSAGSIGIAIFAGGKSLYSHQAPIDFSSAAGPSERSRPAAELAERIRKIVRGWRIRRIDAVVVPGGVFAGAPGLQSGLYRIASKRGGKVVVDRPIVAASRVDSGAGPPENFGIAVAADLARHYRAEAYALYPAAGEAFRPGPGGEPLRYGSVFRLQAAARRAAEEMRRPPEEVNLVVVSLDREFAAVAIRGGEISDYSAFSLADDRGPSPGPGGEGKVDTDPARGGDETAPAWIRRAAREIGALFVAAGCDVEAIVLTGELIRDKQLQSGVRKRVNRLAPVVTLQECSELEVLATAAAGALAGKISSLRYRPGKRRMK